MSDKKTFGIIGNDDWAFEMAAAAGAAGLELSAAASGRMGTVKRWKEEHPQLEVFDDWQMLAGKAPDLAAVTVDSATDEEMVEALLAMAHLFIIHFFIAHLRRHSFPMDRSMFEGSAELDATRHEKAGWIARLEQTNNLETLLVAEKTAGLRALFYIFGYAAIAVGVFLLIGGLVNSLSVTW